MSMLNESARLPHRLTRFPGFRLIIRPLGLTPVTGRAPHGDVLHIIKLLGVGDPDRGLEERYSRVRARGKSSQQRYNSRY